MGTNDAINAARAARRATEPALSPLAQMDAAPPMPMQPQQPPWAAGHQSPFAMPNMGPTPASGDGQPSAVISPLTQNAAKSMGGFVRVAQAGPDGQPVPRGPVRSAPQSTGSYAVRGGDAIPLSSTTRDATQGSYRVVGQPIHRGGPARIVEPADANVHGARVRTAGPSNQPAAPGGAPAMQRASAPLAPLTVVLSAHRRPMRLRKQIDAIRTSSVSPAKVSAWVNPGGINFDEPTLSQVHTIRPSSDEGPWMRFWYGRRARTRFVAILDDDCLPGSKWLQNAMQRIHEMSLAGHPCVIAAAGYVFRGDDVATLSPIGPESPRLEENEVDIGRGGWVCEASMLTLFDAIEPINERGWAYHMALAVQQAGGLTMVLPYDLHDRETWGMKEAPTRESSISAQLDELAQQGQGYPLALHNADLYRGYREAGWTPQCVQNSVPVQTEAVWEPTTQPVGEIWNPADPVEGEGAEPVDEPAQEASA
jgi:hypothetical protein